MRIKVWLDSQTSKQSTLLGFLAKELMREGYETIITCREYEFTVDALRILGLEPRVVGSYVESDGWGKVEADATRMLGFINLLRHHRPNILISYPNPSAARVAFGVGLRYLALTDSPHSYIPSRLALPLADVVMFSEGIPKKEIEKYVISDWTRTLTFKGVDELVWILRRRPSLKYIENLGLKPWNYVIVRPHEEKATYYRGLKVGVNVNTLVRKLSDEGYVSVILPRYSKHESIAGKLKKKGLKVLIPQGGFDGVSLSFYAKAVITGGSSMAREAAFLMTTGITYFPKDLYVNKYVAGKGYPLFKASSTDEILELIRSSKVKKANYDEIRARLLKDFEDPLPKIISVVKGLAN